MRRHFLKFAMLLSAGLLVIRLGWRFLTSEGSDDIRFRDVSARAGLAFTYDNDASPERRFVETTGGGCAFLDINNDGSLDIFAVQGGPAPGSPPRPRPRNALYLNQGDGTFRDVTAATGLGVDTGYGQGVAAADYDNDGWTDLLVTSYGGLHLFRNRQGRFERVTRQAGLRRRGKPVWPTSAAWGDFNRDGFLDLFVCHYLSWSPDTEQPWFNRLGRRGYCVPLRYPSAVSALYRNNGNGTFTDVTIRSRLAEHSGRALGAVWTDFDGDDWPDLFVANDLAPNWLLRNLQDGTFEDHARVAGVESRPSGDPLAGMGVACADYNSDGWEDLVVTNFSGQPRSYYLTQGHGTFAWATEWAALGESGQPFLAFGVEQFDFDLDGDRDLVIGNGHLDPAVDELGVGVTYRERQQLFRNRGDGSFEEDRRAAGDLQRPRVTRGLAVGDYDNDGRPDCLISGPGTPVTLFRNQGTVERSWVGLRLEGRPSNRGGVGARVELWAGGRKQVQVVRSGSSYCSRSDPRLLFGLGSARRVDRVEVSWPNGARRRYGPLAAKRYYLLPESGDGIPDPQLAAPARGASGRS